MVDEQKIREALGGVLHPGLQKPLVDLGMIRDIRASGEEVSLTLLLKSGRGPLREILVRRIEGIVSALPGVSSVRVEVATLPPAEAQRLFPSPVLKGLDKVAHIVAVASGKGGVGKTTIAINLALALAREGYRTGLLDADIYGPSVPLMLGLSEALEQEEGMIVPEEKFGLEVVSMGMTAGQDEAFIWRGPLVAKMIRRLLGEVRWGRLDYLVIDLPPGTGDPSITVGQLLPRAAILLVTTPQEASLADVRRAVSLFRKHNLRIAGLVENMSFFLCGHADRPIEIFGHGGGEKLSQETGLPLLAAIPLDLEIGRGGDAGVPLMAKAPESGTGRLFDELAGRVAGICRDSDKEKANIRGSDPE